MDAITTDLIARWKAEYTRVNGKPAPDVFYRSGWFTIKLAKCRRGDIVVMIERLSKRLDGEFA